MTEILCESNACIEVNEYVDPETGKTFIRIRSSITGTSCQCTPEEWHRFLTDLGDGKWAHIAAKETVPS